jgi:periplasmic glucans biosynthesis protein
MAFRRLILPFLLGLVLVVPGDARFEPGGWDAHASLHASTPATGGGLLREGHPDEEAGILRAPATPENLFAEVTERARALAQRPWSPPPTSVPRPLAEMDYDAFRSIRFRPDAALWGGEAPFEVQFFHPGFLYPEPVQVNEVTPDTVLPVPFEERLFQYDGPAASLAGVAGPDLGFAGFRIHYPVNDPDTKDEVVVFLGASYFRLLGRGHAHGLSSRGVAINTVHESGEEFPDFREFWLVRPSAEDATVTVYALLDGPSLTGAYRFDLTPGAPTVMEVDARLFAREDVERLGVAPLTSMFLYGPDGARRFDDFRPRVHDSDGLLMLTGTGEWIWRPLSNGPGLRVTSLRDRAPQGFGLAQRARDFSQYLDLETRYHDRPSQWVEVGEGDWGEGGVELVEIPTTSEFNDNIVAYWVSDVPFQAGDERRFQYRLLTFDGRLEHQRLAQVERSRSGWDALPGEADPPPRSQRRFVIDFVSEFTPQRDGDGSGWRADGGGSGWRADGVNPAGAPVEAVLESSSGRVSDLRVQPLPGGGGWRATFRLEPEEGRSADMRLFLVQDDAPVTETWSYLWIPEPGTGP